jgi:hypothetical protein
MAAACAQCAAAGAVCAACWAAPWAGAPGLAPGALLRAATDRKESGAVERLLSGAASRGSSSLAREVLSLAPRLAGCMYGSHVLQAALAAVGRALAAGQPAPHLAAAVVAAADATGLLQPRSWHAAVADSCGTHVARSMLLLFAGACPAAKRKPPKRGVRGSDDAWPTAGFDLAALPALKAALSRAAAAAAAALRTGGTRMASDAHVGPTLCLLLSAVKRTGDAASVAALLVALQLPSSGAADALASTAVGSRVLEAALEAGSPDAFAELLRVCILPRAAAWCSPAAAAAAVLPVRLRADAKVVISFILAADGSARAYKPELDESMWWGRRDAHVRIAAAALWRGDGEPHAGVDACSLLYADASLMRMQADALVARCPVPTEGALVGLWRDAASGKRVPGLRAWRPALGDAHDSDAALQSAFAELFAGGPQTGTTLVCLLHEDCPLELPVWGRQHASGAEGVTRIIFIAGAVRDLTDEEEYAARQAAHDCGYTFVGCNLGRTPEFSSKIVSALCTHHANDRLVAAVAALARRGDVPSKLPPAPPRRAKRASTISFVFQSPARMADVCTDLDQRARMHDLLQTCVCALWRSRVVDEDHQRAHGSAELLCTLTVVFADGAVLQLGGALVSLLAAAHQAAPSEHQVLGALAQQPASAQLPSVRAAVTWVVSQAAADATVVQLQLAPAGTASSLASLGYADRCACGALADNPRRGDVVVLLNCAADGACAARLSPLGCALSPAAAVCFVQQLFYHGRLFPALDLLRAAGAAGGGDAALAPPSLPAAAAAPTLPRSGCEHFIVSSCFPLLGDAAQLAALLRCVDGRPVRDAGAAGLYAAAVRAALRLDAAQADVARMVFAGVEQGDTELWPALLCLNSADPCEAGRELLCELLKLPAACTAPLRRGFRALLRDTARVRAWALHNDGSRALEAAMQPSPALSRKLQRRAVRACLMAGLLPAWALHPKASWCAAALWGCAALQGGRAGGARAALRAAFKAELQAVPGLEAANPRLWQRCELSAKRQKCNA